MTLEELDGLVRQQIQALSDRLAFLQTTMAASESHIIERLSEYREETVKILARCEVCTKLFDDLDNRVRGHDHLLHVTAGIDGDGDAGGLVEISRHFQQTLQEFQQMRRWFRKAVITTGVTFIGTVAVAGVVFLMGWKV